MLLVNIDDDDFGDNNNNINANGSTSRIALQNFPIHGQTLREPNNHHGFEEDCNSSSFMLDESFS